MQYNFDTFLASAKTIKLYLMRIILKYVPLICAIIIIITNIIIHTDMLNQERNVQI
jgi:hypothetical protein